MKKTCRRILPALLMLALLSGCAGGAPDSKTAEPSAAPAAETAAPEETPAPQEQFVTGEEPLILGDVPLEGAESGSFYDDGSFPGGLDDDGRGEEESYGPVPVDYIEMTDSQQYEANIFLSNFAEQFFDDFYCEQEDFLNRAVNFAHIWYKINDRDAITYSELDGEVYETLTLEQADAAISRYFPFSVDAWTVDSFYTPSKYAFYRDGAFRFPAADGEAYNRVAVASGLTLMSDGSYLLDFEVYEVDLDEYFDLGVSGDYYRLDPEGAADTQSLTLTSFGTARVLPNTWNGRETYQLLEYSSWHAY